MRSGGHWSRMAKCCAFSRTEAVTILQCTLKNNLCLLLHSPMQMVDHIIINTARPSVLTLCMEQHKSLQSSYFHLTNPIPHEIPPNVLWCNGMRMNHRQRPCSPVCIFCISNFIPPVTLSPLDRSVWVRSYMGLYNLHDSFMIALGNSPESSYQNPYFSSCTIFEFLRLPQAYAKCHQSTQHGSSWETGEGSRFSLQTIAIRHKWRYKTVPCVIPAVECVNRLEVGYWSVWISGVWKCIPFH